MPNSKKRETAASSHDDETDTPAAAESKAGKRSGSKPLVRDSFTFPQADYALFGQLKQRALLAGLEVKKGELLRAGLHALANMTDTDFAEALAKPEKLKTGRPSKA
ncbi:hypothetical protein [Chitinimonas sp.]|uniref:hypothetical protein n=1 Tax=Chitinimonas sp. TaxID=1934313 RepID=UPI0035B3B439